MLSRCLDFFPFKFWVRVGRLKGRFFFQAIFGVESGLSSVHSDTGHWTFHVSFIGGEGGGFIFLSANRKGQGALFLFLLNWGGGTKDFFFSFLCFLMCSHGVPSKFLMGSRNVPQVHNVFPNMFSV